MLRSGRHMLALTCASFEQNGDIYVNKLENSCSFKNFTYFVVCLCTFYVTFQVFFVHFLAKSFKNLVLTAQKNLLLECLHPSKPIIARQGRKN